MNFRKLLFVAGFFYNTGLVKAQYNVEINKSYKALIYDTYNASFVKKTGNLLPAPPPYDSTKKSNKKSIILVKIFLKENPSVISDIEEIFHEKVMYAHVPDSFVSVNKELIRERTIDTSENILSDKRFYPIGTYTVLSVFIPEKQTKEVNVVYFEVIRTGKNKRNKPWTQLVKLIKREGVWIVEKTVTTEMS